MDTLLGKILSESVCRHVQKGEGTGAASKILSGLTFPVLTVLAVHLVLDAQYIPLAAIAALIWTRLGFVVVLVALGYFVYIEYWLGAAVLLVYQTVLALSYHLGRRNVKRLLLAGKPIISPFEGMPDLLPMVVVECLLLAAGLLTRGWVRVVFACLLGLVALWHYGRYRYRLRPRWNQIHGPLMFRYAAFAGLEAGESKSDGREFSFFEPTKRLIMSVYPHTEEAEAEDVVLKADERMATFADRDLLSRTIRKRSDAIPPDKIAALLDEVERHLHSDEGQGIIVRYVIAEVVKDVLGEEERGEYLLAVILGKAK